MICFAVIVLLIAFIDLINDFHNGYISMIAGLIKQSLPTITGKANKILLAQKYFK